MEVGVKTATALVVVEAATIVLRQQALTRMKLSDF
jgi:hypothetical protein